MCILYTLTKLEDLNLDNFIIKFCSDVIGFFLLSYYIILYYIILYYIIYDKLSSKLVGLRSTNTD
jgi:hypothetical protein